MYFFDSSRLSTKCTCSLPYDQAKCQTSFLTTCAIWIDKSRWCKVGMQHLYHACVWCIRDALDLSQFGFESCYYNVV